MAFNAAPTAQGHTAPRSQLVHVCHTAPASAGACDAQPPTAVLRMQVAMCSTNNGAGYCLAVTSGQANPHVNTGAMVDGPDIADGYNDERSFMSMAGVHLDNNAGLSGGVTGGEHMSLDC